MVGGAAARCVPNTKLRLLAPNAGESARAGQQSGADRCVDRSTRHL